MTGYHVEFHAKGDAETIGLPADAFSELVKALGTVSRDPWARSRPDEPDGDPSFRWVPFGELGAVHFRVDDDRQVITVYAVTWTG